MSDRRLIASLPRDAEHELRVYSEPGPGGERLVLAVYRRSACGWVPARRHRLAIRASERTAVAEALRGATSTAP